MLRIIAGELRSRLFKAPRVGRSRPMSDRARMALFNILGDLSGSGTVLDAYGGSGALAFEALSRGVQEAVIIEMNRRVYAQLVENVKKLGLEDRVKTYRANNLTCLNNLGQKFDLILLDPPYDDVREENILRLGEYLAPAGCLVLSYPPHFKPPFGKPDWECLHQKAYAHLRLAIYERTSSSRKRMRG